MLLSLQKEKNKHSSCFLLAHNVDEHAVIVKWEALDVDILIFDQAAKTHEHIVDLYCLIRVLL